MCENLVLTPFRLFIKNFKIFHIRVVVTITKPYIEKSEKRKSCVYLDSLPTSVSISGFFFFLVRSQSSCPLSFFFSECTGFLTTVYISYISVLCSFEVEIWTFFS